ncbi:putative bifunctional diguanylate cyclase/phosphodiesterase [Kineosporia mesophila]|uniref:putative bifunctional diguanylate cyclase/phosphodiesterase n=1 Tax=Kineosporia mesophila TaxID=566012 RepID=UPI001E5B6CB5|nr:bifunctional diguanylate cyclase/phosphodiesterase [Kineosporia mesophila]
MDPSPERAKTIPAGTTNGIPRHLVRIRAGANGARPLLNGPFLNSKGNGEARMSPERIPTVITNGHPTPPDEAAIDTALFAWEWARLLSSTGYVTADRTVVVAELRRWTIRLIDTLGRTPFDPSPGTEIGQALVTLGFGSPIALGRTNALVMRKFLVPADDDRQERVAEIVSFISQGFVRAVRDRTLEEQDAIRSSALLALERARADRRQAELLDPVTGLLNRKGFVAALTDRLATSPPGVLGVCLLSLDGFEPLDRGFGTDVGDELLRTVAERLSARFGGEDDLIGRIGRDEFIVAAIGTKSPTAGQENVLQRVAAAQLAVRAPISLGDRAMVLSPSVGVVSRLTDSAEPETVLRDAGLAGSWARERGTGSIALFEIERATKQVAGLALAAELPGAIGSGRLLAHYQPIVGLRSGRVETVEALARWEHERHGLLEPHAFIPLAQRAGLIDELGRSVLERACRQGLAWNHLLPRGPVVSVNLDPQQLTEPATVRDVVTILERTGLPAELLQLEITEDAALGDPATRSVIRDLAHIGVSLALDDFGTGQAHLARLPDLPALGVHTLKLAGEFLSTQDTQEVSARPEPAPARLTDRLFGAARHHQPPAHSSARRDVLAATIALAHRLGLAVTVEGVKTEQDEALIISMGADHAQGTYYSAPLPVPEAGDYLIRGR